QCHARCRWGNLHSNAAEQRRGCTFAVLFKRGVDQHQLAIDVVLELRDVEPTGKRVATAPIATEVHGRLCCGYRCTDGTGVRTDGEDLTVGSLQADRPVVRGASLHHARSEAPPAAVPPHLRVRRRIELEGPLTDVVSGRAHGATPFTF